jgi:hypothetical protein
MEVSERLGFDAYHNDPRFERKKPRLDQTWREACGDNIYHPGIDRPWEQEPSLFHRPEDIAQDTRHPVVFISEHFYYFGANAPAIHERFVDLIRDRHGCKCSYPAEVIQAFVKWLRAKWTPGVLGEPRDLEWVQLLPSPCGRARSNSGLSRSAGSARGRSC